MLSGFEKVATSNELSTLGADIKQEVDVDDYIDTATNVTSLAGDSSVSIKVEQFLDPASDVSPKVVDSWSCVKQEVKNELENVTGQEEQ